MPAVAVRPRPKPARFARVLCRVSPAECMVELEERRPRSSKSCCYWVRRLASDYGTAFRFEKFGGESYELNLDESGDTCECMGFLAHGHKTVCRHVAAAKALIAAGKLG